MNMPGFNAEASFHRTVLAYSMAWGLDQLGNVVWPQQTCDQTCLDDCTSGCPDPGDCGDLPTPRARAACVRAAAGCYRACFRRCCR
jgi:hypothetical protein